MANESVPMGPWDTNPGDWNVLELNDEEWPGFARVEIRRARGPYCSPNGLHAGSPTSGRPHPPRGRPRSRFIVKDEPESTTATNPNRRYKRSAGSGWVVYHSAEQEPSVNQGRLAMVTEPPVST